MRDVRFRFRRAARQTLFVLGVLWASALAWTSVTFALALNARWSSTQEASWIAHVFDQLMTFVSVVELMIFGTLLLFLTWLAAPRVTRDRIRWLWGVVASLFLISVVARRQGPYLLVMLVQLGVAFEGLRLTIISFRKQRSESALPVPKEEL